MSHKEITYRPATKSDVAEIKQLLYTSWINTYADTFTKEEINKVTSEWHSLELLTKQILEDDGFFEVAVFDEEVVAMCNGSFNVTESAVYINRIHVLPEFHRQGIGSELMKRAVKKYPQAEKVRLEVETNNHNAISFYKKTGFVEADKTNLKVLDVVLPCVIMEKSL